MKTTPAFVPPRAAVTLTGLGGLRAAGVAAGIKASGKPDVALLVADEPMVCAGVFTQNSFAAAPVIVSREHLAKTGGRARAIVINAGNANACTGDKGFEAARAMCERTARLVGCDPAEVLVASTGVIGVPLPIERVLAGIDAAHAALSADDDASRRFLDAIQTTDAFPKEASFEDASLRVAGVAKGAGMIEPNMATMIALVGTDAILSAEELTPAMPAFAAGSFNAVHVDSHASTNDTFFVFSTGRKKAPLPSISGGILGAAQRLAWLIARDGEGATKVTTVEVRRAPNQETADEIARRVAHSALVRTALFGNDPNWGRFVSALGNSPRAGDVSRLSCILQGIVVFERGEPTAFDRAAASKAMAAEDVSLVLDLDAGEHTARVMTSDLSYRYVEVNAEYTT